MLAVAQELVAAYRFGIADTLDAFWIAFLVPSLFTYIIGSSLNIALIPSFIQVREQEGEEAAQKLLSGITVWSLGLLGIATVLIIVAAPLYLRWLGSGFAPEKLDLTFRLLCVLAPTVLLSGLTNIWGAILNAGERFALAALSPITTPAVGVLFLLTFKSWGIFALAIGILCGEMLELIILGLALKRRGLSLRPRWYGFSAQLRQVIDQFKPKTAGAFLRSGSSLVDHSMAAMLSAGSVSALNYGYRVIGPLVGVVGSALGTAVTPYFSKMVACDDWQGVRHTFRRYLLLIFLIAVPTTIIIFIFSGTIVQLIFERGSFTARDTTLVAQIQAFYALQIPFFIANVLVTRLISSLLTNRLLMWSAMIYLVTSVVLNLLFIRQWGIAGIALSTSCASLLNFAFLTYCLVKIFRAHR
jgi:putative peptidoglycan lipid II flippase